MTQDQMFKDRRQAGKLLAVKLMKWKDDSPVILALPRGGVPVGYEVAQALKAPLDILLVRKIAWPNSPEVGLGAVVEGNPPFTVLNEDIARNTPGLDRYIETERQHLLAEIERRRKVYRGDRSAISVRDRTVIVVDDGIATGGTLKASLKALAHAGAKQRIIAVPVAPRDTLKRLSKEADATVCLLSPYPFYAVGVHYKHFDQLTDREVIQLLGT